PTSEIILAADERSRHAQADSPFTTNASRRERHRYRVRRNFHTARRPLCAVITPSYSRTKAPHTLEGRDRFRIGSSRSVSTDFTIGRQPDMVGAERADEPVAC